MVGSSLPFGNLFVPLLLFFAPLGTQQVAKDVEEEEDRHSVEVREEALQIVP